jgi:threonine/homoserine/homoserine lactone efflux protein
VPALYLAYVAATFVLVITPGATTAVVVKNTLAHGHRAGIQAAIGAALANTMHATLAGLGLWVLVGRWPLVLDALRVGGAAYLAWLGVQSLGRAAHGSRLTAYGSRLTAYGLRRTTYGSRRTADGSRPERSGFVEGLTINILNPAIISFYLAVVPTFMPPSPPPFYFTLLAVTHVGLALLCHSGWATAFHGLRHVFARPGVRVTFDLACAVALLWLAARVLGRL